jgi:hypothetical protein
MPAFIYVALVGDGDDARPWIGREAQRVVFLVGHVAAHEQNAILAVGRHRSSFERGAQAKGSLDHFGLAFRCWRAYIDP